MEAWELLVYILTIMLISYLLWCYCCVYQSRGKGVFKRAGLEQRQAFLLKTYPATPAKTTSATDAKTENSQPLKVDTPDSAKVICASSIHSPSPVVQQEISGRLVQENHLQLTQERNLSKTETSRIIAAASTQTEDKGKMLVARASGWSVPHESISVGTPVCSATAPAFEFEHHKSSASAPNLDLILGAGDMEIQDFGTDSVGHAPETDPKQNTSKFQMEECLQEVKVVNDRFVATENGFKDLAKTALPSMQGASAPVSEKAMQERFLALFPDTPLSKASACDPAPSLPEPDLSLEERLQRLRTGGGDAK